MKKDLKKLGSTTAKAGFENENSIVEKFNSWKRDSDAKNWLVIMGYSFDKIKNVEAEKLPNKYKADVQIQIKIYTKKAISKENLSIKLVSNPSGFNQIGKGWVRKYVEMYSIPKDVEKILKLFTGEILPRVKIKTKDSRRMFFNEMTKENQKKIMNFFTNKKRLIVSDALKGKGKFSADWMLVIQQFAKKRRWILKSITQVINYYAKGKVKISPRGSLKIGKITLQRKGGDAGRNTANMLQFKINPTKLFD